MSNVVIYRVEDHAGWGPYQSGKWFGDGHLPCTEDDARECDRYTQYRAFSADYRHGFESLERLNNWFDYERQTGLIKKGFKLVAYTVSEEYVLHFSMQSIFDPEFVVSREEIEWPVLVCADNEKELKVA